MTVRLERSRNRFPASCIVSVLAPRLTIDEELEAEAEAAGELEELEEGVEGAEAEAGEGAAEGGEAEGTADGDDASS